MAIKECDNKSVGVIIQNPLGRLALLTRGRFPIGVAPAAGHIDGHGSAEQAALDEVREELGIDLAFNSLRRTVITNRRVDNVCRRPGGDHHLWTVYTAITEDDSLLPDPDETNGADWYTAHQVQMLAERTRQYKQHLMSEQEWAAHPGLEPVWAGFLQELGYVGRVLPSV